MNENLNVKITKAMFICHEETLMVFCMKARPPCKGAASRLQYRVAQTVECQAEKHIGCKIKPELNHRPTLIVPEKTSTLAGVSFTLIMKQAKLHSI